MCKGCVPAKSLIDLIVVEDERGKVSGDRPNHFMEGVIVWRMEDDLPPRRRVEHRTAQGHNVSKHEASIRMGNTDLCNLEQSRPGWLEPAQGSGFLSG